MQVTNLTDQNIRSASILNRTMGRGRSILSVLTSNPKIAVGVGIVAFFVLIAVAAPLLTPYNPDATIVVGSLPPSSAHILGTSGLGQDMFAQLVYGARVTLLIGFVAAIGSTLLQIFFGLTSGYFGGVIGDTLALIINVFLVLPGLPLAIVLASLASANSAANKNEFVIALVSALHILELWGACLTCADALIERARIRDSRTCNGREFLAHHFFRDIA